MNTLKGKKTRDKELVKIEDKEVISSLSVIRHKKEEDRRHKKRYRLHKDNQFNVSVYQLHSPEKGKRDATADDDCNLRFSHAIFTMRTVVSSLHHLLLHLLLT